MHPFPSSMLAGANYNLIGYVNVPSIGATTWNVPYPSGTSEGDYIAVIVGGAYGTGGVNYTASGATTLRYFLITGANYMTIFMKQLDATDISSGISATFAANADCATVLVFRGVVSESNPSQITNVVAVSNGGTATLIGSAPTSNVFSSLGVLMTNSTTFTADSMGLAIDSETVHGSTNTMIWQIFSSSYAGEDITWGNVANMGYWCAALEFFNLS